MNTWIKFIVLRFYNMDGNERGKKKEMVVWVASVICIVNCVYV